MQSLCRNKTILSAFLSLFRPDILQCLRDDIISQYPAKIFPLLKCCDDATNHFFAKIHPASIKRNLLKPVQSLTFAIALNNQRIKARMNKFLPTDSNKILYQTFMVNSELKLKAINQVYKKYGWMASRYKQNVFF